MQSTRGATRRKYIPIANPNDDWQYPSDRRDIIDVKPNVVKDPDRKTVMSIKIDKLTKEYNKLRNYPLQTEPNPFIQDLKKNGGEIRIGNVRVRTNYNPLLNPNIGLDPSSRTYRIDVKGKDIPLQPKDPSGKFPKISDINSTENWSVLPKPKLNRITLQFGEIFQAGEAYQRVWENHLGTAAADPTNPLTTAFHNSIYGNNKKRRILEVKEALNKYYKRLYDKNYAGSGCKGRNGKNHENFRTSENGL